MSMISDKMGGGGYEEFKFFRRLKGGRGGGVIKF